MPEMPEVQALTDFLGEQLLGQQVAAVEVVAISALKTYAINPASVSGSKVTGIQRHGKWIDVTLQPVDDGAAVHLIFHLARAGWLRWRETLPQTRPRGGPLALRLRLEDGSGFELTEAGTKRKLAVFLVHDPQEVERIATLGVEPLSPDFTAAELDRLLDSRNQQLKGLLRDQGSLAGIGNAYSDEILHVAHLSPFALTRSLDQTSRQQLFSAITSVLQGAIAAATGKPAAELKDAKRQGMRVHGRSGQACPECGDTVREVSFADSSLQYCPTCQTGGKLLADRRLSRLLK